MFFCFLYFLQAYSSLTNSLNVFNSYNELYSWLNSQNLMDANTLNGFLNKIVYSKSIETNIFSFGMENIPMMMPNGVMWVDPKKRNSFLKINKIKVFNNGNTFSIDVSNIIRKMVVTNKLTCWVTKCEWSPFTSNELMSFYEQLRSQI